MKKVYYPFQTNLDQQFSSKVKIGSAVGFEILTAEKRNKQYVVKESRTLADMLGEEDKDLLDKLIKVIEFNSKKERENFLNNIGYNLHK